MIDVLLDVLMIVVCFLLGYLVCKLRMANATKKSNAFNPLNEPYRKNR